MTRRISSPLSTGVRSKYAAESCVVVIGVALGRLLEQEELRLAPGHHREAHLPGPGELPLERHPRAAGEGLFVGRVDVAEEPRDAATLVVIGQNPERVEIGLEKHVGFLDADESLDRGAVEHDLTVERLLELTRRHLDVLVDPEDVGELESQKVHAESLGELEDGGLVRAGQHRGEPLEARSLRRARRSLLGLSHSDTSHREEKFETVNSNRSAGKKSRNPVRGKGVPIPFARLPFFPT